MTYDYVNGCGLKSERLIAFSIIPLVTQALSYSSLISKLNYMDVLSWGVKYLTY